MQNDSNDIEVVYTSSFRADLKALSKRYRSIKSDIQPTIEELKNKALPGAPIPGLCDELYKVVKVRVKNTNIKKGLSGGYRLIYCVVYTTDDISTFVSKIILVSVYSKSDQKDISHNYIKAVLSDYIPVNS